MGKKMNTETFYYLNPVGLTYEDFGGEMVAVNFDTGRYYGLTDSARIIWQLLSRPRTQAEIVEGLEEYFKPGEYDMGEMVVGFLKILDSENLLLTYESSQIEMSEAAKEKPIFMPPNLEVHEDLQELIMLDPVHDADLKNGWPVRKAED